ncbi:hypothetical protein ABS71_08785 [bacterium SCN 62-11]|nr:hypothetical protein [Candidatus Eremiobacteraeota bacterium]ODT69876.1 MAG: hypothetical protein ABS71_08785 [bacterium SCN 62-11]
MGRPSELEDFLRSQIDEGAKDSSGKFTLSREKALEKLAAYQLQGGQSWVLKVIQAVVAAGASELSVRQTGTDTEFHFSMPEPWLLAEVEDAFYDPEVSPNRSLDHLKRGLWSVSLHNMRPFLLAIPGCPEALVWTGKALTRGAVAARQSVLLAVSHRTIFEGKGIPLLRNLEAASGNAEVLAELRDRAFTCSIPLKVDNRRMDALQACPKYGVSKSSYPVYLAFLGGDLPELKIPPATFGKYRPQAEGDSEIAKLFHRQTKLPEKVAVGSLITAHVREVKRGKATVWEAYSMGSCLYWVRDGVVVDWEHLKTSAACISCALFVSAEGLATDLTGLKLARGEAYEDRVEQALEILKPFVSSAEVSLEAMIRSQKLAGNVAGGIMLVGAVTLGLMIPIWGLFLAGGALMTLSQSGSTARALDQNLKRGLERLQQDINRLRPTRLARPYETQKDGP